MLPVLVFDMFGTLLDTEALASPIRRIFGRKLSAEGWFTEVTQHSMALSLAGEYISFGELAMTVLEMSAAGQGVRLRKTDMERVKNGMKRLPPFPDVKKGLKKLKAAGYRLAVLTNSARESLPEQLRYAGLEKYLDEAFSVDMVRRYKPAPDPYRAAAHLLGVDSHQMVMVAAHPWDLLGAARAGCRTALLLRPGKALWPGAPMPEYVARDLRELADRLSRESVSRGAARDSAVSTRRPGASFASGLAVGIAGITVADLLRAR